MQLHEYETTLIFRPDLDEAEQKRLKKRFWDAIADNGGDVLVYEDWGRRRMAYKINGQDYGGYRYFNYAAASEVPSHVERVVKIEDNVVRFLTIKIDEHIDLEETRLIARERQKKRLNRAQQTQDDGGRGRSRRPTPDSMLPPLPVNRPEGSAVGDTVQQMDYEGDEDNDNDSADDQSADQD